MYSFRENTRRMFSYSTSLLKPLNKSKTHIYFLKLLGTDRKALKMPIHLLLSPQMTKSPSPLDPTPLGLVQFPLNHPGSPLHSYSSGDQCIWL